MLLVLKEFVTALRGDLEKESHVQHTKLDLMQANFNKKSTAHRLKPDNFDGNPVADALAWLDIFCHIAKLNNWSEELQLNAFPLCLRALRTPGLSRYVMSLRALYVLFLKHFVHILLPVRRIGF